MEQDIKEEVRYRLRNPLFGSFTIAFIASNWKAILLIFYPESSWLIRERLSYIAQNLYNEPWELRWLFLWPIIIAVLAVTVLPWIINALDYVAYWAIVIRKKWRHKLDSKLPEYERRLAEAIKKNENQEREIHELREKLKAKEEEAQHKSLWLAKTFKSIATWYPKVKDILITLHNQGGTGKLTQSNELNLLKELDLLQEYSTGTHKLTKAGNGVAETLSV